jgi:hypothetical protein
MNLIGRAGPKPQHPHLAQRRRVSLLKLLTGRFDFQKFGMRHASKNPAAQ